MNKSSVHIPLVDLSAQYRSIRKEIDKAIKRVIKQGIFIGGDEVKKFAVTFANIANTPYCIPCANGTDALEIALLALGIGKRDEVIIPAFSFVATMEAVCNVGAKPIFCDVLEDRLTLDPKKLKSLITEKTKAIIPVHLYGQMADMKPIMAIAKKHKLFVIEDAAQSHKAEYNGLMAGSIGHMATFSFYPGKNLGAYGDAGAITTNDEALYNLSTKIANHGRVHKYDHDVVGRNSRLDALQAAILNVKAAHLEDWIKARRKLAARYDKAMMKMARELKVNIRYSPYFQDNKSVYHLYVIRVGEGIRDGLRNFLEAAGIETGIHYPIALTELKATTGQLKIKARCPVAEKASREVISLPLYPELKTSQQDYIIKQIRKYFTTDISAGGQRNALSGAKKKK